MRIIAGKHKGRKLLPLVGDDARPTLDRVRENLFNILSNRVVGANFLDLFAGSGAVGIEALSRGAGKVVFCDKNPKIIAHIRKNLALINESCDCVLGDYKTTLKKILKGYDIIYLDPPYAFDSLEVLTEISNSGVLASDGIVVYEHDASTDIKIPDSFELFDERKYGIAKLSFLRGKNV